MALAIQNAIAPVHIAQEESRFPCQGASIMALSERLFDIRLFMGLSTNALGDAKYDNSPSVRLTLCNGTLDGRTACLGLDVHTDFICLSAACYRRRYGAGPFRHRSQGSLMSPSTC
ncbi:hypothetical protein PMIN03_002098 [Paraphaeosphaeria minitans]